MPTVHLHPADVHSTLARRLDGRRHRRLADNKMAARHPTLLAVKSRNTLAHKTISQYRTQKKKETVCGAREKERMRQDRKKKRLSSNLVRAREGDRTIPVARTQTREISVVVICGENIFCFLTDTTTFFLSLSIYLSFPKNGVE